YVARARDRGQPSAEETAATALRYADGEIAGTAEIEDDGRKIRVALGVDRPADALTQPRRRGREHGARVHVRDVTHREPEIHARNRRQIRQRDTERLATHRV